MIEPRRYLTRFTSTQTSNIMTEVLVIGSGVAGLRAAIAAADHAAVLLVCKGRIFESNTYHAQGGIAIAPPRPDSIEAHIEDTLRVACGLGNPDAIKIMIEQAPSEFDKLIDWGMSCDRHDGSLAYTLEGGHSEARVVHANGDATGQELSRVLVDKVQAHPAIRVFEECFVIDLLSIAGRCVGAVTFHPQNGRQLIGAQHTILATGGCGRVYRETTNPKTATGDGHAMAFRAGARLQDMEMVQFHPTALYVAGASRALISEAVRGEGGQLVDRRGQRFMVDYHRDAELAPRDVVSRAILNHMIKTESTAVFLDVRGFGRDVFRRRFPNITQLCAEFGIDVARDLIPVRPAAHFMIGGVSVDLDGRSSLPGLWACGEAAATGVHGANRLASNSLLEGLVFGARCGLSAATLARSANGPPAAAEPEQFGDQNGGTEIDLADLQHSIRSLMWRRVGILRDGQQLAEAIATLDGWARTLHNKIFESPQGWETHNVLTAALLIAKAAHHRTESRGVHYRKDFPETDDRDWKVNLCVSRESPAGSLQFSVKGQQQQ